MQLAAVQRARSSAAARPAGGAGRRTHRHCAAACDPQAAAAAPRSWTGPASPHDESAHPAVQRRQHQQAAQRNTDGVGEQVPPVPAAARPMADCASSIRPPNSRTPSATHGRSRRTTMVPNQKVSNPNAAKCSVLSDKPTLGSDSWGIRHTMPMPTSIAMPSPSHRRQWRSSGSQHLVRQGATGLPIMVHALRQLKLRGAGR